MIFIKYWANHVFPPLLFHHKLEFSIKQDFLWKKIQHLSPLSKNQVLIQASIENLLNVSPEVWTNY